MSRDARDEILVNVSPGEVRAAIVEDGRLAEIVIERTANASVVGNVYLGRVRRVVPSLDAAFVDIGLGRDAFLSGEGARNLDSALQRDGPRSPIADYLTEGEAIVVQAAKDAHGEKGVDLTTRLSFPGHLLVYSPFEGAVRVSHRIEDEAERERLMGLASPLIGEGEGVILRTAAEGAVAEGLAADIAPLRALWDGIEAARDDAEAPTCLHAEPGAVPRILRDAAGPAGCRVRIDDAAAFAEARRFAERLMPELAARLERYEGAEPIFAGDDIEGAIEDALRPRVALPSGGSIVIESTEALTAIDVNTAANVGRGRREDAVAETNREAATEIARQLRLRNIGGRVVIDFISMRDGEDRSAVLAALESALAADRLPVRLGGMTTLGLVELTRKRERDSLERLLRERCDYCEGERTIKAPYTVALECLRAAAREAAAVPGRALTLVAAPEVVEALDGEARPARAELEDRLGRPLALRVDETAHRETFEIEAA